MTEAQVRKAAVAKLKEHGITVHRYRQSAHEIAKLVQFLDPSIGGTPENILRRFVGLERQAYTASRPRREYMPDLRMRLAIERARQWQPPILPLSTRVPYTELGA